MKNLENPFQDDVETTVRLNPPIRPIHYLGSKLRIAPIIREVIDQLAPSGTPVCDLFAGSGSASSMLAQTRPVTAVDIQEYSRIVCTALLRPQDSPNQESLDSFLAPIEQDDLYKALIWVFSPLIEAEKEFLSVGNTNLEPLCDLMDAGAFWGMKLSGRNSIPDRIWPYFEESSLRLSQSGLEFDNRSLVSRYYGGLYFGFLQAIQLDVLLNRATSHEPDKTDFLKASILSAASEAANTVGKQFAQPLKPRDKKGRPKRDLLRQVNKDRSIDVFKLVRYWIEQYSSVAVRYDNNRAIRSDYSEFLRGIGGQYSAIYADPPYTRDHYSRFYHVLETICLRDNPEISLSNSGNGKKVSRALYRKDRYQSPFCIMSQARDAFKTLFKEVVRIGVPLVLSYSPHHRGTNTHPRVVPIEDLTRLVNSYFSRVDVVHASNIVHSRLNRRDLHLDQRATAELLITCSL